MAGAGSPAIRAAISRHRPRRDFKSPRLPGLPLLANELIVFASAASSRTPSCLEMTCFDHISSPSWRPVAPGDLSAWATSAGYEPVTIVQRVGEFARRGGIIDLYSLGASGPVRLDFFGDEIDSIRLF